jgi:hypothetical protein
VPVWVTEVSDGVEANAKEKKNLYLAAACLACFLLLPVPVELNSPKTT